MANFKVFYSFHYEDVGSFKVNIIRNSSRLKCYHGLLTDQSIWEEYKAKSDAQIKKRIDNSELMNSDATVILIGENTHQRRWVKYEIIKSFEAGNTLIGIHINRVKGKNSVISRKGLNPFDRLGFRYDEEKNILRFYELVDRKWQVFKDLPFVENHKENTVFVKPTNIFQQLFGNRKDSNFYRLSDYFPEYTWKVGEHNAETLFDWVKENHEWIKI